MGFCSNKSTRAAILFTIHFCTTPYAAAQEKIDAAGKSGSPVGQAQAGVPGRNAGANGGKGQQGGAGNKGAAGQNTELNIQVNSTNHSILEISGTIQPNEDRNRSPKAVPVYLKSDRPVTIDTRGGDGGAGGQGGVGGPGAKGKDGSGDSNGDKGGDGGQGGKGGIGGAPGDGGKIRIHVSQQDSYSLKNLRVQFAAGRPGQGGPGGLGGQPGTGGKGGSGTLKPTMGTDSEGHATITLERSAGGHQGTSGSSGQFGDKGADATSGRDGSIEYELTFEDGSVRTFNEIFDLELVDFTIEEQFPNGNFMPGETIWVRDLVVKNTGRMPTPPPGRSYLRIQPQSAHWFAEDNLVNPEGFLQIPTVIEPDTTYTFAGRVFGFVIDDFALQPITAESLKQNANLLFMARVTTVDQPFSKFDTARSFIVRYPIELETIHAAPSLKRGDRTFGFIRIRNLSDRAIGSLAEIGRQIEVDLGIDQSVSSSDAPPAGVEFNFTGAGERQDSANRAHISMLKARETTDLPFSVRIDKDYAGDAQINVVADLLFETVHEGVRPIQRLKHSVRIAEPFEPSSNTAVVLITNNQVSQSEVDQWRAVCRTLGLETAVWDISLYANFDIYAKYFENEKTAPKFDLVKELRGRTAVVFGGEFTNWSSTEKVNSLRYLSYEQVAELMEKYETNFLFYGMPDSAKTSLDALLVGGKKKQKSFTNTVEFTKDFGASEARAFGSAKASQIKDSLKLRYLANPTTYRITPTAKYYFNTPSNSELLSQAHEVEAFLKQHDPARQFAISVQPGIKTLQEKGRFTSGLFELGTIEIRTLPAVADSPLVVASRTDSDKIVATLVHGLHFKTRLEALNQLLIRLNKAGGAKESSQEIDLLALKAINNSLVYDLSHEIEAAAQTTHWLRDSVGTRLPLHKTLSEFKFSSPLTADSPASEEIHRLLARMHLLKHFNYTSRSWVYGNLPITHGIALAWHANSYRLQTQNHLFSANSFSDAKYGALWSADYKAAMKPIDEKSSWYPFYWRKTKLGAIYNHLRAETRDRSVRTTHDVVGENYSGLLKGSDLSSVLEKLSEQDRGFADYTKRELDGRGNTRNVMGEGVKEDDFNF